jgi:hypothetical protein
VDQAVQVDQIVQTGQDLLVAPTDVEVQVATTVNNLQHKIVITKFYKAMTTVDVGGLLSITLKSSYFKVQ